MNRYQPFNVVALLEHELCEYTGAPYCTVVHSCTDAIGICLEYFQSKYPKDVAHRPLEIPKFTYIGVPMQIRRAGFYCMFREEDWEGEYKIEPYNLWDSARRFRKEMWEERGNGNRVIDLMGDKVYKCLSFHRTKILGHSQGGAIIHNDPEFVKYSQMMRFDGRTPGVPAHEDNPTVLGRHCYMDPEVAAALLHNLFYLPDYNPDLPNDNYPDLSKMEIFK